jgi:hypothetical protein
VYFTQLYVLFVIELKTRAVHILKITDHPDNAFVTQVGRTWRAILLRGSVVSLSHPRS